MFGIPRLAKQLEEEWADALAERFGCTPEQIRADATPFLDYPSGILRLELMDGSNVEFHWAFHLLDEREGVIAVFTEHCGHHLYPTYEAKVFRDGALVFEHKHV